MSDKWCVECLNAKWCKYIHPYKGFYCPGFESLIDNKTPRKEPLAADLIGEGYDGFVNRDYKDVMGEVRESKEQEHGRRHEQIMEMPDDKLVDLKRKCIAAMLFFGVGVDKIAHLLRVDSATVYRVANKDAGNG